MKSRFFRLSLLLVATLTTVANASMESVEATVAQARNHLGGDAKLDAIDALQYRGTVTLYQGTDAEGNAREPLVGTALLSFQKPSSQKIEFHFPEQSLVTGFNGFEGYEYLEIQQEVGDPIRNIRSIGGDELRRNKAAAIENLRFFRPFAFDNENVRDRGFKEEAGNAVHQIDFIHNGKFIFSRIFDTATGDLLRTELDTGMVTYETGEMIVDGMRFSTHTRGELEGEVRYEMVFETVVINPELASDFFDYPMF